MSKDKYIDDFLNKLSETEKYYLIIILGLSVANWVFESTYSIVRDINENKKS